MIKNLKKICICVSGLFLLTTAHAQLVQSQQNSPDPAITNNDYSFSVTLADGSVVEMKRAAKTLYANDAAQFDTFVLENGIYKIGPSSVFRVSAYEPEELFQLAFKSSISLDETAEKLTNIRFDFLSNVIDWIYFLEEKGKISSGLQKPYFKERLLKGRSENNEIASKLELLTLELYGIIYEPIKQAEELLQEKGLTKVLTGTPLDMGRQGGEVLPNGSGIFDALFPKFGTEEAALHARDLLNVTLKCMHAKSLEEESDCNREKLDIEIRYMK